jgi:hypothetical protein
MRIALSWVAGLAVAVSASGQTHKTPDQTRQIDADARTERAWEQKEMEIVRRAYELRPSRRDEPLRYVNLSDNEMREIQDVAQKYLTKTMLNVSPVIEGCPCEEGPMCTDQVYVVTFASEQAKGLQLSRVKGTWQIGVVQQWWTKFDALVARSSKADYRVLQRQKSELLREFPTCVGELVPAKTTASIQKAEPQK